MTRQFEVRRDDLSNARLANKEMGPLAEGAIRLAVDRFAFTANNMTYGVAGDMLGYWQFFPPTQEGWGIIPVWGLADIIESRHPDLKTGDRLYGYFPPAGEVDLLPGNISPHSLTDMTSHRQALPPLYNRYQRMDDAAGYDRKGDDALTLLAPLHITSFCLYDALRDNDWHGAGQVLIASASSKTSLGLAFGLARDNNAPPIIGLTSSRNLQFVEGTGLYDQVIAYDALDRLPERASVLVDMAGNRALVAGLYQRLGDLLRYRYNVGITHWQDSAPTPGEKQRAPATSGDAEMFFAPKYVLDRVKEWGAGEFDRRSKAYVADAACATFGWMSVERRPGLAALEKAYPDFVDGSWPPEKGLVITLG